MESLYQWLNGHQTVLWALGAISVATFAGSLILVPILVVRMPADHFRPSPRQPSESWAGRHPVRARALVATKNVLGALLVLAGIAMLVLPGQGILTILIGISITSFPGKRTLERKVIGMPAVQRAINWMRARRGRPPLEL